MSRITACIVLYKNDVKVVKSAVDSLINSEVKITLYLIDHSPDDDLSSLQGAGSSIVYIHNPLNPGFGAGHNFAIELAKSSQALYHFVINPDVHFGEKVIGKMITYMEENPGVGMMMPQILNENGTVQNLPKLLPTPFSILWRKLKISGILYENFIDRYELRFVAKDIIYNAPILSGCFTLFNIEALKEIGGYDDSYFMYFEDWDLSRRMHQRFKTIYFPSVSVFHGYESGANKSSTLFKVFLRSAIIYFNKWGWLLDKERIEINKKALEQFSK